MVFGGFLPIAFFIGVLMGSTGVALLTGKTKVARPTHQKQIADLWAAYKGALDRHAQHLEWNCFTLAAADLANARKLRRMALRFERMDRKR